jgi:hypothetical protein
MQIRRTIIGVLILLLGGAAAAGTYFYYVWNRSDELLRKTVEERINEIAPGWNVSVGRARIDFQGRVHLYEVKVPGENPAAPILEFARAVLTVDRETLADPHPAIQHILIEGPRANLERGADGVWNVARLPPLKLPRSVIPECRCEKGHIDVRLTGKQNEEVGALRLDGVGIQMIPSARRQFRVRLGGRVSEVAELSAEATWNIEDRTWSTQGSLKTLRIDRQLVNLAREFSTDVNDGFERLAVAVEKIGAAAGGGGSGAARGLETAPAASDRVPTRESWVDTDLAFRIAQWKPGGPGEFQIALEISDGEVSHPGLSYAFTELKGRLTLDNEQFSTDEFQARSGETRVKIGQCRIRRDQDAHPAGFDLEVSDLPIDDRLYRLLSSDCRTVFDAIQPTGSVDVSAHLEFNGRDRWEHEGVMTLRDCTAAHVKFPYRVDQISGTVKSTGNLLEVNLAGRAGTRPVSLRGKVRNPGPEALALFYVESAGLPIDAKLYEACPPDFRAIIDLLLVRGELDGWVRLTRPAGAGQPVVPFIKARLRDGTALCRTFPYPLAELTGRFEGTINDWQFNGFQGRHGESRVLLSGTYRANSEGIPCLDLKFDAKQVPCDRLLLSALPVNFQEIWNELNPQGTLAARGTVFWHRGIPPQVALDGLLTAGKLVLRSFPYSIDDVEADFGIKEGHVTINTLSGRHDETHLRARGRSDLEEDGEWRLRLDEFSVENLEAGQPFRKTLPPRLRSVVDAFDPRGRLSISGMLEFRGRRGDDCPVTAAWDTVTVYTGNTITAGVDLKDMHGTARFLGTWDGEAVSGRGQIDLNSVKVMGYALADVHGPVSIEGNRLIVGSRDAKGRSDRVVIDNSKRITARFIDGQVGLDAIVRLGDLMRYEARITLTDGELRRFAQTYMQANHKLAGIMNGWVDLAGEGTDPRRLTGTGQLEISPAALYELPLIVAIFNVLTFVPVDKAAFDLARFQFDIGGALVQFRRIDFEGKSINLVGRGAVRFDGNVSLDFLSSMGRNQLPIPIVRELLNEATKGWVGVRVTGPIKNPQADVRPIPQIDEALRRLLGGFDARGPTRR